MVEHHHHHHHHHHRHGLVVVVLLLVVVLIIVVVVLVIIIIKIEQRLLRRVEWSQSILVSPNAVQLFAKKKIRKKTPKTCNVQNMLGQ